MKTPEEILKPYLTKILGELIVTELCAINAINEYSEQYKTENEALKLELQYLTKEYLKVKQSLDLFQKPKNRTNTKDIINKNIEFYKNECNPDYSILKEYDKYINFVNYLMGENELQRRLDEILAIKEQLSFKQFIKVVELCEKNGCFLLDLMLKMTNKESYTKGKKNLYICLTKTWIQNNKQESAVDKYNNRHYERSSTKKITDRIIKKIQKETIDGA